MSKLIWFLFTATAVSWLLPLAIDLITPSESPPDQPEPVVASAIGSHWIHVQWQHPSSADSAITICVLKTNIADPAEYEHVFEGMGTDANVTALQPARSYWFIVICKNSFGWSAYSTAVAHRTLSAVIVPF